MSAARQHADDLGFGPEAVKAHVVNVLRQYELSARQTLGRMSRVKKAMRSDAHQKTMDHWRGVADGLRWLKQLIDRRITLPDLLEDDHTRIAGELAEVVESYNNCLHADEWPVMKERIVELACELVGVNLKGGGREP